jgi:hypothetical protein
MHIFFPIIAATVLVFFGYFAIWSSSQPATPKGVASFGKILSIILFVIAGLALASPVAVRHFHGGYMMNKMECRGNPASMGCPKEHWMNRTQMQCDKNRPENAPEEKPQSPSGK